MKLLSSTLSQHKTKIVKVFINLLDFEYLNIRACTQCLTIDHVHIRYIYSSSYNTPLFVELDSIDTINYTSLTCVDVFIDKR